MGRARPDRSNADQGRMLWKNAMTGLECIEIVPGNTSFFPSRTRATLLGCSFEKGKAGTRWPQFYINSLDRRT